MVLIVPTHMGIANLKFLLLCFENMSGLKINFDKSQVVVAGVAPEEKRIVADMLNCKPGSLPMKYLGLPVRDRPLRVADWEFLPGKVEHRVDPGHFLGLVMPSRAGKFVPIQLAYVRYGHLLILHILQFTNDKKKTGRGLITL
jgi:hypothetical protein